MSKKGDNVQIGRLMMRQEGGMWNAYYGLPADEMPKNGEDPELLGSIRMKLIISNPRRKEAFMSMMREIVADMLEEATGTRPTWGGVTNAPESERSGRC